MSHSEGKGPISVHVESYHQLLHLSATGFDELRMRAESDEGDATDDVADQRRNQVVRDASGERSAPRDTR